MTVKEWVKQRADWILSAVSFVFALSLIPMVFSSSTVVPLTSSIPTAAGLWIASGAQYSLDLRKSCAMTCFTAAAWTFIALVRH